MLNQIHVLLKTLKHRTARENKEQYIQVQLSLTKPATSSFITILKYFVTNMLYYICYHEMVNCCYKDLVTSLCSFKIWLMDILCPQKPTSLKIFNCFSSCINATRGLNPSM